MKKTKRLLALLLTVFMMMGTVQPIFAEDNQPAIELVSEAVFPGESVKVDVVISNNPGIIAMWLDVSYISEYMTLTSVEDKGLLNGQTLSPNLTNNPYRLIWGDDTALENNTANGTIATLTFKVAENAPIGKLPLSVHYDNVTDTAIYDKDLIFKDFAIDTDSSVTIKGKDFTGLSFASKKVTYDGTEHSVEVTGDLPSDATVEYKSDIMDDIRKIGESIDAEVIWNNENKSVTFSKDNKNLVMQLNNPIVYIDENPVRIDFPPTAAGSRIVASVKLVRSIFGTATDISSYIVKNKATKAGLYAVHATVSALGYNKVHANALLEIERAPLTVTGIAALNGGKNYDGTNEIELTQGTLVGLVERDKLDENGVSDYCDVHGGYRIKCAMPTIGTVDDANAGKEKTVNIPKIELTGCSAGNYVLTQPTGVVAEIKPVSIKVTAINPMAVNVGAQAPKLEYSVEGEFVGDDKLIGELALAKPIPTSFANGVMYEDIEINQGTLAISGNANNYNLTFVGGKLRVKSKTPQNVEVKKITEKTYGDDKFMITVNDNVEGADLGTFTHTSSNKSVADFDKDGYLVINGAGTTDITIARAGNTDLADFSESWTLTVNKKAITIKAEAEPSTVKVQAKTEDVKKTLNLTDETVAALADGDIINEVILTLAENIPTSLPQGTDSKQIKIMLSKLIIKKGDVDVTTNYQIDSSNLGYLTVVDKELQTITVADKKATAVYGDADFTIVAIPDETSKLDKFEFESSNTDVATVDVTTGLVKIVGAGTTVLKVIEPGDETYAPARIEWTLTVAKKEEYKINSITIRDTSGNELDSIPDSNFLATISITNILSGNDTMVILARYTKTGEFKGLMYVSVEDVPIGSTIKLSLPIDNTKGEVAKLKAFSLASFNSLAPLGLSVSFPKE